MDINLTNNTTFTLIDNLPFNTSDYNDVLIVAENKFRSNLLNRAYLLDSITFTYSIKNRQASTLTKHIRIFIFTFILFSSLYCYFLLNNQYPCIMEMPINTVVISEDKPNKSIFGLFIELFKVTNTSYKHYPSYFLSDNTNNVINVMYVRDPAGSFILECVRFKQFTTLNYLTQVTVEHLETMQIIRNEYSDIIGDLNR